MVCWGKTGPGKSTLIKILTCKPGAGWRQYFICMEKRSVIWGGITRALIGYLPQESVGYPRMRVGEFLEYIAALKGLAYDRKQLREIIYTALEQVHLEKEIYTRFGQLSGGMKRPSSFCTGSDGESEDTDPG